MTDKTIEYWEVKDTDGELYLIQSDNWTVTSEGLAFYIKGEKIAHFLRWANYIKAKGK